MSKKSEDSFEVFAIGGRKRLSSVVYFIVKGILYTWADTVILNRPLPTSSVLHGLPDTINLADDEVSLDSKFTDGTRESKRVAAAQQAREETTALYAPKMDAMQKTIELLQAQIPLQSEHTSTAQSSHESGTNSNGAFQL